MFENLRAAFRDAVKNFKDELDRDQVPEAVDRLLLGMKAEVTDAKARLHDLEEAIRRARAEAAREAREVETCRRRESMARSIGDEETARIAAEYGAKHERRREVLEEKAQALEKELELRRSEIEEMLEKIRQAQKERDALSATAGRTQARESIRGSQDLFDELDRMAEEMVGGEHRDEDELARDIDLELGSGPERPRGPGTDLEARLAELKRRMGKD